MPKTKVVLSPDQQEDLVHEIDWLIDNSEGVVGLKMDGSLMPWAEVVKCYLPTTRKRWDSWRDE